MTSDRRRQMDALVEGAVARAEGERAAYLDAACGEDAELRRDVESLVAGQSEAARLLELPPWYAIARTPTPGASPGSSEKPPAIDADSIHRVADAPDGRGMGTPASQDRSPGAAGPAISLGTHAVALAASAKVLVAALAFAVGRATGVAAAAYLPPWVTVSLVAGYAGIAGLLLAGGTDARARTFGAFLLLVASAFADPLLRGGHALGGAAAVAAHVHLDVLLPFFLWTFAREFPATANAGRSADLARRMAGASLAAGLVLAAANVAYDLHVPPAPHAGRDLLRLVSRHNTGGLYWPVLLIAMIPVAPVLVMRTRGASAAERRRVAIFVASVLAGLLPISIDVVLRATSPAWASIVTGPTAGWAVTVLVVAALLSVPATTAYAVLVDRVIDIRDLIRTALQYALARYSVLALVSLPFVWLGWLVWSNRQETIRDLLAGPAGLLLLASAGLGVVTVLLRTRVLAAIDQRFFREHYDAQQILTSLVGAARKADSSTKLAELLGSEIDRALHVERAVVLIRDAAHARFVAGDGSVRPLPEDTLLVRLASGSDEPLAVGARAPGSPYPRLGEDERQWLAEGPFELAVPLRGGDGDVIGLLALGPKKSRLPYTPQDRRLLAAIGASGGICLDSRRARDTPARAGADAAGAATGTGDPPAVECCRCGQVFPDPRDTCACGAPVTQAVVPGVVAGKFRVRRRIGSGGMGVVYQAEDVDLQRTVAIKTLPRVEPAKVARLRREAQSMARVTHPNLEIIYGLETWRDRPVLVVEYLPGGTLGRRVAGGRLEPADVIALGFSLTDALQAVHAAGLLHRDVKPSNIGFAADGTVKLLDFGIAKLVAGDGDPTTGSPDPVPPPDATPTTDIVGTPAYMAPEAIRRESPGPSFDLWGLAVVLFEACTGVHPFTASSVFATVARVLSGTIPDPRDHVPDSPPSCAEFFRAVLAPDRHRRPQSASEFRACLAAWSQAAGGPHRPPMSSP